MPVAMMGTPPCYWVQQLAQVCEFTGLKKFYVFFQPAEEAAGTEELLGAQKVLQTGPLQDALAFFGLHVDPSLSGTFATAAGSVFASTVKFQATLYSKGGCAGVPHLNRDCISCAAPFIDTLQTLIECDVRPTEAAVINMTQVQAGGGQILSIAVQKQLQLQLEQVLHFE